MREIITRVIFDNTNEISPNDVRALHLKADIRESVPTGYLLLSDPSGAMIRYLRVRAGSFVEIQFRDVSGDRGGLPAFGYTKMIVVSAVNLDDPGSTHELAGKFAPTNGANTFAMGGSILLDLIHPWKALSSPRSRGFLERGSEIIKKIAGDGFKGFVFSAIRVSPTDDSGREPFYKTQETETDFIKNKLLPYLTINGEPTYCFVNESNELWLTSFLEMYKEPTTLTLVSEGLDVGASGKAALDGKNFPGTREHFSFAAWQMGTSFLKQIKALKSWAYGVDNKSGAGIVGKTLYAPGSPGTILISKSIIGSAEALDATAYPHESYEDALSIEMNKKRIMDEFYMITVECGLAPDLMRIGKTCNIVFQTDPDTSAPHWASGKWLILATEYVIEGSLDPSDGATIYGCRLILGKPTINHLPKDIKKSDYLAFD